ncbi:transporter [Sphingomonas sp. BK580]|uniref:transporter n=1 Tax=Sphingomonas sp. BK580 TaxID=2586972 RepID=UPI001609A9AB|nr:transporter [Sphingomonas sp. BK580]MBB3694375.1 hypothetical protein [Sphingomonas sp. BK580]
MIRGALLAAMLLLAAAPAAAEEEDGKRFCPNRPSLGASGCVTLPGQVQVEVSGVDWQRDDSGDSREDLTLFGDVTARIGLTANSELQVEFTPLGTLRTRDKATGAVSRKWGVGDTVIGYRYALSHPDGNAVSSAIQPYVALPTGRAGIGDGDWAAGVIAPVYWQIDERWSLDFTGQAAAAVDDDGHGRHFDASGVVGLGYALTDSLTAVAEVSLERDDDPSGHVTRTLAAGSLAWQPTKHTQIDLLAVAGLNRDAPDARLVLGGAFMF